jgi:hypothetical protein
MLPGSRPDLPATRRRAGKQLRTGGVRGDLPFNSGRDGYAGGVFGLRDVGGGDGY